MQGLRILPFRTGDVRPQPLVLQPLSEGFRPGTGDAVIEALQARGIQTRPVWALIHEQADYPRNEAYCLDKAEDYRRHIVNLPCSTNLSLEDCERVCQAVLSL